MSYVDVLVLFSGFAVLSFGIYFSIYLHKNEKSGLWDEIVKNRRSLFVVSIISLICGYIATIYGMKNIVLSTLGAGLILLSVYFFSVAIFYKSNFGEIKKANVQQK